MKTTIILIAIAATLGFSFIDFKPYNMNSINAFLTSQVDRKQTPSIQYALFDTEGIIHELQYGAKNVKGNVPADSSTTYHLFSVTKTFTALAVLQLAEAGKIELEKPMVSYLPEFPYAETITVSQLLSHTAGIPNPLPLRWIHLAEEHSSFRRDSFFKDVFAKHPKLDFEPGSDFKYSNLGYVVLGQLVERVSGQTFEQYVHNYIITPAGANKSELNFILDSSTHATGYHKWWSLTNAALGFMIDKDKFMGKKEGSWQPFKDFYNNGIAYGGMFGSANGLIKYAQALLQPNSILLNDEYKKMLFTEVRVKDNPTGMSLSWFTGSLKGNRYVAHAGGGGGYYVELRVYPDLGIGSVIMYNRSGMTDERILDKADGFFVTEKAQDVSLTVSRR